MDDIETGVMNVLRDVLGATAAGGLDASSSLLGAVAELDSMAVVAILTRLEEHFGIGVADDDVDGRTFESVRSLAGFVRSKLDA
jgi:acyl carrier protein